MRYRTLDSLSPGETAVIIYIEDTPFSERLKDVGFTEGTAVTCRIAAPCGDPVAYSVRGTLIAIRKNEAQRIHIR